jgi:hypothetical protein
VHYSLHIFHTFLDREWDPKTKILKAMSCSAFGMPISYFLKKQIQKVFFLKGKVFFFSNYICMEVQIPEFYAHFRSEGILKKKCANER